MDSKKEISKTSYLLIAICIAAGLAVPIVGQVLLGLCALKAVFAICPGIIRDAVKGTARTCNKVDRLLNEE
jgi:hypothetical protein